MAVGRQNVWVGDDRAGAGQRVQEPRRGQVTRSQRIAEMTRHTGLTSRTGLTIVPIPWTSGVRLLRRRGHTSVDRHSENTHDQRDLPGGWAA